MSPEFVSGPEPAVTTHLVWCPSGFPHALGVVSETVGCYMYGHMCADLQMLCTYGWSRAAWSRARGARWGLDHVLKGPPLSCVDANKINPGDHKQVL